MNLVSLKTHLMDALRAEGDVFTLGLDHAAAENNLTTISAFAGRVLRDDVAGGESYAFAYIDSNHVTDELLDALWSKMSYGASVFFTTFKAGAPMPRDKVIKRFMDIHADDITIARQMLVNGRRETNLIVKCFSADRKPQHPVDDETITIATVFKTGGDFDVSYVNHIANSIKEHTTVPYKFVVLTDHFEGYCTNVHQIIPFDHNFPKWWGKMELFKPEKFDTEKIFYIDLDTCIVDNIDDILQYGGKFFGLRDFYSQCSLGSGVLYWKNHDARVFQLYEAFMENPAANMNNNQGGDQQFIRATIGSYIEYVQDLYPKAVVSYKKDCLDNKKQFSLPDGAKIVCFHGPPRPKAVRDPEMRKHWRG
jgi:hypothetical protein